MKYIKCPACESKMVLRNGTYGQFYGCSTFPRCRKSVPMRYAADFMVEEEDRLDDDLDVVSKSISGGKKLLVSMESPLTKLPEIGAKTASFPLLKFKFDEFSPEQTACMEYYDKDANMVVALSTGGGKTSIAEMFMAHTLSQGKRVAYVSPLRALTQEKFDDWSDEGHTWCDIPKICLTGDWIMTKEREKILDEAKIILFTAEMLSSKVRKVKSEKSLFLSEVGTLIIDESHLICTNRGPSIECGLIKFTKYNPDCRIVFLSATMPNVVDMCGWLTKLNGKKTDLMNSDQRPVPLEIHWVTYGGEKKRDEYGVPKKKNSNEDKMQKAIDIVREYPDDNFLLFVHAKATGRKLKERLLEEGIESEFHCADLSRNDRARIEYLFRNKEMRVLIATSTLAMGINV